MQIRSLERNFCIVIGFRGGADVWAEGYKRGYGQGAGSRIAYKRSMYGRITKADAAYIREIMYDVKYDIPDCLKKAIEFDLKFVVKE